MNTMFHPTEEEMVGWKTLRLRLPDRAEVLTKQSLGRNAFYLAAQRFGVLCVAVSYAVYPLPPVASSPEGGEENRVSLGRPLGVEDTLVLGEDQGG